MVVKISVTFAKNSLKRYTLMIRTICKVKYYCLYTCKYRGAAHDICNSKYRISKEISIVFDNGSNYDYHFIIKELAEELKGQFNCLKEITEKYVTFSLLIKKLMIKRIGKKPK